jgi:RNA polymerase sigma-70 factor (ECF subfamily)
MHNSDRTLIEAHLGGDSEAFETIVRRYGPAVYGFLLKMVKDTHKTEDLFQDTFQKACQKAGDFRGDNLKPWILTIAANNAINSFRREQKHRTVSLQQSSFCEDGHHCSPIENAVCNMQGNPVGKVELEEKRTMVRDALMRLPEKQRAALVLSYYQKLPYPEIAETQGCSVGTVKTNIFRALKRLATLLPVTIGGMQ